MRDQKLQILDNTKTTFIRSLIVASLITILCWLFLYLVLSPIAHMELAIDRLIFALKCWGIATLFCLVLGIEAVAHERLGTFGISILGDGESLRLRINQRYLQQTIEQILVFIPALLMLAIYCDTAESMRLVEIATIMWMGSRFGFWLGYHHDLQLRAPGMIGMLQNLIILLYGCSRFGYELAGMIGSMMVISIFVIIEWYLLAINKL